MDEQRVNRSSSLLWPITWCRLTVAVFILQAIAHYFIFFSYFANPTTDEILRIITYALDSLHVFALQVLGAILYHPPSDPEGSGTGWNYWKKTTWRLMTWPEEFWRREDNIPKQAYLQLRLCLALQNYFTAVVIWLVPNLTWLVIGNPAILMSRVAILVCSTGVCGLFALWSHLPVIGVGVVHRRTQLYTSALDNWLALVDALQTMGSLIVCLHVLCNLPASSASSTSSHDDRQLSVLYVWIVLPLGWILELVLLHRKKRPRNTDTVSRPCCVQLRRWITSGTHSLFVSLPLSMASRTTTLKRVFEAPVPRFTNPELCDVLLSWVKSHPAAEVTGERLHACERALNHFLVEQTRDKFSHIPCSTTTCTTTIDRAELEWVRNVHVQASAAEKRYVECPANKRFSSTHPKSCHCYDQWSWWWDGGTDWAIQTVLNFLTLFLYLAHQLYWCYMLSWLLTFALSSSYVGVVDSLLVVFLFFLAASAIVVWFIIIVAYGKHIREWYEQQRLWYVFGNSTKSILLLRALSIRIAGSFLFDADIFWNGRLSQPEIKLGIVEENGVRNIVERLYSQHISILFQQALPTLLPMLCPELLGVMQEYLLTTTQPQEKQAAPMVADDRHQVNGLTLVSALSIFDISDLV